MYSKFIFVVMVFFCLSCQQNKELNLNHFNNYFVVKTAIDTAKLNIKVFDSFKDFKAVFKSAATMSKNQKWIKPKDFNQYKALAIIDKLNNKTESIVINRVLSNNDSVLVFYKIKLAKVAKSFRFIKYDLVLLPKSKSHKILKFIKLK